MPGAERIVLKKFAAIFLLYAAFVFAADYAIEMTQGVSILGLLYSFAILDGLRRTVSQIPDDARSGLEVTGYWRLSALMSLIATTPGVVFIAIQALVYGPEISSASGFALGFAARLIMATLVWTLIIRLVFPFLIKRHQRVEKFVERHQRRPR